MRSSAATHSAGVMIKPQADPAEPASVSVGAPARPPGAHRKPAAGRQMWPTFAAVVVSAAAIAAVGVLVLLRADPVVRQDAPVGPTPASTATVTGPASPPREPAPAVAPPPAETPVVETTRATVRPAVPPTPSLAPTTVADEPEATRPQPPATRAPISVAPETRPPFPHQNPPEGGDNRGGLLGGGGLL